jgi:ribosomal protein S18 acetylase RimI-like enzyme
MDKPEVTYRTAMADDVADILTIFAEVADEVPTIGVIEGTKELVAGLVATGASSVALDENNKIVGYLLAEGDGKGGISLFYLGVTSAARGKRVCSRIVARLKERGVPITASVRHNNKSAMAERFKRLGFDVLQAQEDQTKFRWEPA